MRIPVYVINLARRPDRLAEVTAHLAGRGIDFTRIDAVDARSATEAELAAAAPDFGPVGPMSTATRACTASHLKAWRTFLQGDAGHALILEDDVELSEDIALILADDAWIPDRARLVKIEKYNADRGSNLLVSRRAWPMPAPGRSLHVLYFKHVGSAAYIISRAGAEAGVALAGGFTVPIDHALFNEGVSPYLRRGVRPWIVHPGMARQRPEPGASDITFVQAAPIEPWRLRTLRALSDVRNIHRQLAVLALRRAQFIRHSWRAVAHGPAPDARDAET